MFKLAGAAGLVLEFLAQLLQQLVETGVGSRNHPAMCVIHGEGSQSLSRSWENSGGIGRPCGWRHPSVRDNQAEPRRIEGGRHGEEGLQRQSVLSHNRVAKQTERTKVAGYQL